MSLATVPSGNIIKLNGDVTTTSGQLGQLVNVSAPTPIVNQVSDFKDIYTKYSINTPLANTTFVLGAIGTNIKTGYDCYLYNYGVGDLIIQDSGLNNIINIRPFNGIHLIAQIAPNTWYIDYQRDHSPFVVDAAGGTGYTTIQSAINAVGRAGGGVVYVKPGTYNENLTIDDSLYPAFSVNIIGICADGRTNLVVINGTVTCAMPPGPAFPPPPPGLLMNVVVLENISIVAPIGQNALIVNDGIGALFQSSAKTLAITDYAILVYPNVTSQFCLARLENSDINNFNPSNYLCCEINDNGLTGGLLSSTHSNTTGLCNILGASSFQVINGGHIGNITIDANGNLQSISSTIGGDLNTNAGFTGNIQVLGGAIQGAMNITGVGGNIIVQAAAAGGGTCSLTNFAGNATFLNADVGNYSTINIDNSNLNMQGTSSNNITLTNGANFNLAQSSINDIDIDSIGTGSSTVTIKQSKCQNITIGNNSILATIVNLYDTSTNDILVTGSPTFFIYGGTSNNINSLATSFGCYSHQTTGNVTIYGGTIECSIINNNATIINANAYLHKITVNATLTIDNSNVTLDCVYAGTFSVANASNCYMNSCRVPNNLTFNDSSNAIIANLISQNNIIHNSSGNIDIYNSYIFSYQQNNTNTINMYNTTMNTLNANNSGNGNVNNCIITDFIVLTNSSNYVINNTNIKNTMVLSDASVVICNYSGGHNMIINFSSNQNSTFNNLLSSDINHISTASIDLNNCVTGTITLTDAGTINIYNSKINQLQLNDVGSVGTLYNSYVHASGGTVVSLLITGTLVCVNSVMNSRNVFVAFWADGTGTLTQRGNILLDDIVTNNVSTTNADLSSIGVLTPINVPTLRIT